MDLEYRATQQFAEHIEAVTGAASGLVTPLTQASQRLVTTFLQGGKVICGGSREGMTLARHFAELMLHCFDRERLGLPALVLEPGNAAYADADFPQRMAHQLGTLGQPSDILLLVEPRADGASQQAQLVKAAHARQMPVLVLCGGAAGPLTECLGEHDLAIAVPADTTARVLEVQLLALHILCDLIDTQLLGSQ